MDKKKSKTWIWILCAALVVCIAVVGIILVTGKKDDAAKKPSQGVATNTGDSKDKQDTNTQQNDANSSGVVHDNTTGQTDDGGADIDFPYVEIPVEDPGIVAPDSNASGDIISGDSTSSDNGADDGSDTGTGDAGSVADGSGSGTGGAGSTAVPSAGDGDIVLPMVP